MSRRGNYREQEPDRWTDRKEIIKVVKDLNFRDDLYAVCGGAMLVVKGVKKSTHDIDLLVTDDLFQTIKGLAGRFRIPQFKECSKGPDCLVANNIELLNIKGFTNVPDIQKYFDRATFHQGIRWITLDDTILWKKIAGRDKDWNDIDAIELWYNQQGLKEEII